MAKQEKGGAEAYARFKQFDYKAVSGNVASRCGAKGCWGLLWDDARPSLGPGS